MLKILWSVKRTAWLAAFAAVCVVLASPASASGTAPVLTATPGDGKVDLSWTEWVPPPADYLTNKSKEYVWRMKAEADATWSDWVVVDGTTTSTTVDDLENGKAYTFQVGGQERSWFVDQWVLRQSPLSAAVTATPTEADN